MFSKAWLKARDGSVSPGMAFAVLVSVLFVFRLWYMTTLPLSGDEAYHWEWSRHPAGGYYDHPPMTAYLIWLTTHLFGVSNEFTVRLPALVCLTVSAVVIYYLARLASVRLGHTAAEASLAGFAAGALMLFAPVYAVLSVYMSTDPPLILFWSLTLLLLFRGIIDRNLLFWVGAGLCMGLALQSKFLAAFLPMGALLFCLISSSDRKWLVRPHPYVAGMLSLLVLAPFLWWNMNHNWATFMFNLVYRQKSNGIALEHVPTYIGGQMLALSPGVFIYAVYALVVSLRRRDPEKRRILLYLGCTTLGALLYFSFTSLKCRVAPHWVTPAWMGVITVLGILWSRGGRWRLLFRGRARLFSMGLCILLTITMHAILHIPPSWLAFDWSFSGDPDRINLDEHAERFGWDSLGLGVGQMRERMLSSGGDSEGVFVICGSYGFAASVAFYTPGQIQTHLWSNRRRHGENYRFWDNFVDYKGQNAIFVAKENDDMEKELPVLKQHFARVGEITALPIIVDNIKVRTFYMVPCYDFDGDYPYPEDIGGV